MIPLNRFNIFRYGSIVRTSKPPRKVVVFNLNKTNPNKNCNTQWTSVVKKWVSKPHRLGYREKKLTNKKEFQIHSKLILFLGSIHMKSEWMLNTCKYSNVVPWNCVIGFSCGMHNQCNYQQGQNWSYRFVISLKEANAVFLKCNKYIQRQTNKDDVLTYNYTGVNHRP